MHHVYIYAITHQDSGKAYVGSTIRLRNRWWKHKRQLNQNCHSCSHLQRAWLKYGSQAFEFSVIDEAKCRTPEARIKLELKWIRKRGTYNSMLPDEFNSRFIASDQTKKKMSKSMKQKIKSDPEYKKWLHNRGKALAAATSSVAGRLNMSNHSKRRWQNPKERKRLLSGLIKRWKDPKARKVQSQKLSAFHNQPKVKAIFAKRMREKIWTNPEWKDRFNEIQKERWSKPESHTAQSEKMKAFWLKQRNGKPQTEKQLRRMARKAARREAARLAALNAS